MGKLSEVFSNIITLIPLAIIITVQILRVRRKKEGAGKKQAASQNKAPVNKPPLAARVKRPEPIQHGHWETGAAEKPIAPPRRQAARPGVSPPVTPAAQRTPAKTARQKMAWDHPEIPAKQPKAFPAASYGASPALSSAKFETASKPAASEAARSAYFPQRLDYLQPLQRMVAMAEILGPPRGLG